MRLCSVEGCGRKHAGRGYCTKHYDHIRLYGKILTRTRRDLNEINDDCNICRMKLYNKYNIEIAETIFDLKYKEEIKKVKWHLTDNGYVACNYLDENDKYDILLLHQLIIWLSDQEVPDGHEIDHKDTHKLNNLEDNLRICTSSQNKTNVKIRKDNTSGQKGVSFDYVARNWRVDIKTVCEKIYLGNFKDIKDAARAYNEAAIKYFGEFAVLNEI